MWNSQALCEGSSDGARLLDPAEEPCDVEGGVLAETMNEANKTYFFKQHQAAIRLKYLQFCKWLHNVLFYFEVKNMVGFIFHQKIGSTDPIF